MNEVLQTLSVALDYTQELLLAALLLARIMPMVMLTPFLGGKLVPTEVKMGLGVLLTIIIWPLAHASLGGMIPTAALPFLLLMLKEVLVGFVIGFVNAHIFFALHMAGRLIDTARVTAMAEVMDPHSKQRTTPVGDLYVQLFLVIFMVSGAHRVFIRGFALSFENLPVNQALAWGEPAFNEIFNHIMRLTGDILIIAVVLSAPVMAATFIADVVFGILNRVAPQLNAYFMSMPVKALGGVVMIFVAFAAIVARFEEYIIWALGAIERTFSLLFA